MHRHGDTAMMGRTHAASGAAAFLALTPVLSWAGVDATTPTITVGMVAAAGAAMLPDLDHPQATISRALGPITRILSAATEAVSGGHRQATHSVLGVLVFTAFTWVLTLAGRRAGPGPAWRMDVVAVCLRRYRLATSVPEDPADRDRGRRGGAADRGIGPACVHV